MLTTNVKIVVEKEEETNTCHYHKNKRNIQADRRQTLVTRIGLVN